MDFKDLKAGEFYKNNSTSEVWDPGYTYIVNKNSKRVHIYIFFIHDLSNALSTPDGIDGRDVSNYLWNSENASFHEATLITDKETIKQCVKCLIDALFIFKH
jgi:hypothetical protein